ncbi:dissimilatory sulfite reductase D family protein [Maridesulfovibrio frigidus]|uniref:dissimilatory sulfite reductase D family protein n=1 Tax=Maridesulfovibrio frigidus TaxID=340956 RepID=UPI0004E1B887|nr:dissimilatory sulfite reductase D family protein [Maridesulfovibrio frigidus]
MAIELESAKVVVLDFLVAKTGAKSKFYFNDFTKLFPEEKGRDVKKVLTALVKEMKVEYWSSGSTTMYGLYGAGKQGGAEGE